jgi:hypothetical protein
MILNHIKANIEPGGRSIEIDFLRGLALIFIMLDHMPISILSVLSIQHYSLFDATELFVFLSGYCVALAYNKITLKKNEQEARKRFLKRSIELYMAFLITVLSMLIIGFICLKFHLDNQVVKATDIEVFLYNPIHYILNVFILFKQPYFSSILPMYIVFCASSVLIIPFLGRFPLATLLLSFFLWLKSSVILPHTIWSFNPFAWQFIFVIGLFCYFYPFMNYLSDKVKRYLFMMTLGVIIICGGYKIINHYQFAGIDKLNLASIRLISFFSMAWFIYCLKKPLSYIASYCTWIQKIGIYGLPCFIATTILSLVMNTLFQNFALSPFINGISADLLSILTLYSVALFMQNKHKFFHSKEKLA